MILGKSETNKINTMNMTSPGGVQASSLKGKLQRLEETVKTISEEINHYKKEVEKLRGEKSELENILKMKTQEVKSTLDTEIIRCEDELKRNFNQQKAENSKLQQQIAQLKTEKTSLQQQLLTLQRRIAEIEMQVGNEEGAQ